MNWPIIFTDKNYRLTSAREAVVSGLVGWEKSGDEEPPEFFGIGMVKISRFLGVNCNPRSLKAAAAIVLRGRCVAVQ
jgi:hypothetical protein